MLQGARFPGFQSGVISNISRISPGESGIAANLSRFSVNQSGVISNPMFGPQSIKDLNAYIFKGFAPAAGPLEAADLLH